MPRYRSYGKTDKAHYFGDMRVTKKKSQRIDMSDKVNQPMEELRMQPGDYIKTTAADKAALMQLASDIVGSETVKSDKGD